MDGAPGTTSVVSPTSNGTQLQPIRGAIEAEVSTSEPVITAASEFSIFVVLKNPYNVPITIYSVQTHIPIELIDIVWETKFKEERANNRSGRAKSASSIFAKIWLHIVFSLEDAAQLLKPNIGPRIAEAVSTDAKVLSSFIGQGFSANYTVGAINDSSNILIGDFSELWNLQFATIPSNDELDRLFRKIEDYRSGKIPVVLQPGNAIVKQFIFRAREALFFTPIEYTFQIQVKYAVDNVEQYGVVPFRTAIRAAISSTIIGSLLGGLLGSIAQTLSSGQAISLGTIGLSIILSGVAVVAFARKTNTQQIVSVEDFWGGFFVGFLVGYLGESFFRNIIG